MQKLAETKRIEAGEDFDFKFTLPEIAKGQQVRLATDARVDWPDLGGATYYMVVTVNGQPVLGPSLLNKPADLTFRNGTDMSWFQIGAWNLVYSPDFSDRTQIAPTEYGVVSPDPYRFVWDITSLVKSGENTVRFHQNKMLDQADAAGAARRDGRAGRAAAFAGRRWRAARADRCFENLCCERRAENRDAG